MIIKLVNIHARAQYLYEGNWKGDEWEWLLKLCSTWTHTSIKHKVMAVVSAKRCHQSLQCALRPFTDCWLSKWSWVMILFPWNMRLCVRMRIVIKESSWFPHEAFAGIRVRDNVILVQYLEFWSNPLRTCEAPWSTEFGSWHLFTFPSNSFHINTGLLHVCSLVQLSHIYLLPCSQLPLQTSLHCLFPSPEETSHIPGKVLHVSCVSILFQYSKRDVGWHEKNSKCCK